MTQVEPMSLCFGKEFLKSEWDLQSDFTLKSVFAEIFDFFLNRRFLSLVYNKEDSLLVACFFLDQFPVYVFNAFETLSVVDRIDEYEAVCVGYILQGYGRIRVEAGCVTYCQVVFDIVVQHVHIESCTTNAISHQTDSHYWNKEKFFIFFLNTDTHVFL